MLLLLSLPRPQIDGGSGQPLPGRFPHRSWALRGGETEAGEYPTPAGDELGLTGWVSLWHQVGSGRDDGKQREHNGTGEHKDPESQLHPDRHNSK
mmetsp:Transcript_48684/g.152833  ORF Transcript_48684/g.152833 Transcript_48684/m.152833 type:complete len:95 (-) Transcript_48684:42-326(-)